MLSLDITVVRIGLDTDREGKVNMVHDSQRQDLEHDASDFSPSIQSFAYQKDSLYLCKKEKKKVVIHQKSSKCCFIRLRGMR